LAQLADGGELAVSQIIPYAEAYPEERHRLTDGELLMKAWVLAYPAQVETQPLPQPGNPTWHYIFMAVLVDSGHVVQKDFPFNFQTTDHFELRGF
jgi:hypothetical protein